MEQLLSVVKRRTEIKFLIMPGATRTLERTSDRRGVIKEEDPTEVTGRDAPLPTIMEEGCEEEEREEDWSIPAVLVMWEPAPESRYHSFAGEGTLSDMVLKLSMREPWFHDPPAIGVQGAGGCCCCDAIGEEGTPP
jgi:hypothetical protein